MRLALFSLLLFFIGSSCSDQYPKGTLKVMELQALSDFTVVDSLCFVPAYQHKGKNALAIDATKYKGDFALAESVFTGEKGLYVITLITLGETDGESEYKVFLGDKEIAAAKNAPTTTDYAPQEHALGKVRLRSGDKLKVAFNSSSNGKIPEGDAFAYARGRWTMLRLEKK